MVKKAENDLIRCPECGHNVFRRSGTCVERVRFRKGGDEEGENIGDDDGAMDLLECDKCNSEVDIDDIHDQIYAAAQ